MKFIFVVNIFVGFGNEVFMIIYVEIEFFGEFIFIMDFYYGVSLVIVFKTF